MLAHVKRSHAVYLESTDSYKRDLCSIGGIYASYRVCLSCPCLIGPHRHQGRQPDCVNAQHPLSRLADFMISTTVAGARSQFAASPDPSDSISDNENADARVLSIQMPRTPPQDAGGGSSNSPLPAPNLSCSEWAPSTNMIAWFNDVSQDVLLDDIPLRTIHEMALQMGPTVTRISQYVRKVYVQALAFFATAAGRGAFDLNLNVNVSMSDSSFSTDDEAQDDYRSLIVNVDGSAQGAFTTGTDGIQRRSHQDDYRSLIVNVDGSAQGAFTTGTDGIQRRSHLGGGVSIRSSCGECELQAVAARLNLPAGGTNTEAECFAAVLGLYSVWRKVQEGCAIRNVLLLVDSQIISGVMTSGYKLPDRLNYLLASILHVKQLLQQAGVLVRVQAIPRQHNARADALAKSGAVYDVPDNAVRRASIDDVTMEVWRVLDGRLICPDPEGVFPASLFDVQSSQVPQHFTEEQMKRSLRAYKLLSFIPVCLAGWRRKPRTIRRRLMLLQYEDGWQRLREEVQHELASRGDSSDRISGSASSRSGTNPDPDARMSKLVRRAEELTYAGRFAQAFRLLNDPSKLPAMTSSCIDELRTHFPPDVYGQSSDVHPSIPSAPASPPSRPSSPVCFEGPVLSELVPNVAVATPQPDAPSPESAILPSFAEFLTIVRSSKPKASSGMDGWRVDHLKFLLPSVEPSGFPIAPNVGLARSSPRQRFNQSVDDDLFESSPSSPPVMQDTPALALLATTEDGSTPVRSASNDENSRTNTVPDVLVAECALRAFHVLSLRLMTGALPDEVLESMAATRLIAISKANGEVRPISIPSLFRKLVGRCVMKRLARRWAQALAPFQFGVGCSNGLLSIVRGLQHSYSSDQEREFVFLDLKRAFNSVSRVVMRRSALAVFPCLKGVLDSLYPPSIQQVAHGSDGQFHDVNSCSGVLQGCPLATALFATAIQPVIRDVLLAHTPRDGPCPVTMSAYVDDLVISGPRTATLAFYLDLQRVLPDYVGVKVNVDS